MTEREQFLADLQSEIAYLYTRMVAWRDNHKNDFGAAESCAMTISFQGKIAYLSRLERMSRGVE